MDGPPDDFRLLRFSTALIPAADRLDGWQTILARKLLRVDIEALTPGPFHASAQLRIFENLRFGTGTFDASINRRGRRLVAGDNDDFLLLVNRDGTMLVEQRGREMRLEAGDACLLACAEPSSYLRAAAGRISCVRIPRLTLLGFVPHIEDISGRAISHDVSTLPFLLDYLEAIDRRPYHAAGLRALAVSHVHDLMALLLGATGDAAAFASSRGLKAVRAHAVKKDIAANYRQRDLGAAAVAARHNMSARSLQRIFETEGRTFTLHLLELRLQNALRQLRDPAQAARRISDLALDCGFGDMSHFNHAFRRRFGASPGDVRRGAPVN